MYKMGLSMNFEMIKNEVLQLNRRHRINRWIELTSAILMLVFSVYLILISYNETEPGILKSLADGKAYILLAPLAGSLIGTVLTRWNGNRELILLNKLFEADESASV